MRLIQLALFISTHTLFLTAALADFQAHQISSCSYWRPAGDNRGYVCSNIPRNLAVPDAYSIAIDLRAKDDKITELERRIEALERACKPSN